MITSFIITTLSFIFAYFYVGSEFALMQTRRSQLIERIEKGDSNAELALKIKDHASEYLSTIQVGVTTTGLLVGAFGESLVRELFENTFKVYWGSAVGATIGSLMGLLLMTYISVVFTELVPKNLVIMHPEKTFLHLTKFLRVSHLVFFPFVWLMNQSAEFIIKLLPGDVKDESGEQYTPTELRIIGQQLNGDGEISNLSYKLLKNAIEFDTIKVKDIMTPKKDIVYMPQQDFSDTEDLLEVMKAKPFSRYPVKEYPTSYLYVPDLVKYHDDPRKAVHKSLIMDPDTKLGTAILQMKQTHKNLATIMDDDEILGMVTLEDVVNKFLGTISDEND